MVRVTAGLALGIDCQPTVLLSGSKNPKLPSAPPAPSCQPQPLPLNAVFSVAGIASPSASGILRVTCFAKAAVTPKNMCCPMCSKLPVVTVSAVFPVAASALLPMDVAAGMSNVSKAVLP